MTINAFDVRPHVILCCGKVVAVTVRDRWGFAWWEAVRPWKKAITTPCDQWDSVGSVRKPKRGRVRSPRPMRGTHPSIKPCRNA